jgi:hypothetical protein
MEVNRSLVIEDVLHAAGYEIRAVAQVYTSWTIGRGGLYAFFDKRPLMVVVKSPAGKSSVFDIEGTEITAPQALDMVPALKDVL